MLSQQGLCCGSPGADRSTSCGRPQVYLRGWRMASRRRRRKKRRRKRSNNHTDSTGKGYHFDALVRLPLRENDWSSASQETAAVVSAQESAARTEANSAGTNERAQWAVRAEGAGRRLGSHGVAPEADKGATQKRARREEPARSTQHRPSSTGQKIQRRQPRQAARESGLARRSRRTKQLREAVQGRHKLRAALARLNKGKTPWMPRQCPRGGHSNGCERKHP